MPVPADDPGPQILEVCELAEAMPLARIDEELRGRADGLERVPVFQGLRRRTFDVALADVEQLLRLQMRPAQLN